MWNETPRFWSFRERVLENLWLLGLESCGLVPSEMMQRMIQEGEENLNAKTKSAAQAP